MKSLLTERLCRQLKIIETDGNNKIIVEDTIYDNVPVMSKFDVKPNYEYLVANLSETSDLKFEISTKR